MIKIIKQKRRTLSIKIDVLGNVTVKAPIYSTDRDIERFISSKKPWINKVLIKINNQNNKFCEIFNKTKGLYFGKIIDYSEDFINFIKTEANVYLPKRIKTISKQLNFDYSALKVKNYKSRWGSCDKNKNITLNYKLVMIDKDLIDYVIVHELCHTVYFNHKKDFHKLLKSYFKNEIDLRKRLNEFSFINKIDY